MKAGAAQAANLPPGAGAATPRGGRRVPLGAMPESGDMPWMVVATVAINLLALALPLLMLQVFDRVLPNRSLDTLWLLVLGTGAAIGAEALLRAMRAFVMVWAAARFEHAAMSEAYSRLLAAPGERMESGYVDRFKAISAIKEHCSGQTFLQTLDLPFTLVYLGLVALIAGWLVLIPLLGVALFGYLSWRFGHGHGALFRDRSDADRRRSNFLVETLGGIHTVKAMAMESFMLRRYERLQEACANITRRLASTMDVASGVGGLFSPLMTVLVVAAGAVMAIRGELTNGELAACTLLVLRSLGPLQRAGSLWIARQRVHALFDEMVPLFAHPPLAARAAEPPRRERAGRIEVLEASYRAPRAPERLLERISLVIEPGECVVIRGANGSGRSTLLRLIGGLVQPESGEVRFDGRPLRELEPALARAAIAFVPEDAPLFQGTILDNICGFEPARAEAALAVARALGLDKFVARLPRGWDSAAGESAADTMPAGYRQRIAMVRALASGARVVLFDAANISMDTEGDAALRSYLAAEKSRTTFVIATHRPSLEKLADRVLVLEGGRLAPREAASAQADRDRQQPAAPEPAGVSADAAAAAPSAGDARPAWERVREAVAHSFRKPSDLTECLPELLRALNWRGEPRDVAEALPYFEETLDLSGLLNCMAQLGYHAGESELRLRELDRRLLPCLFLPREGAAMVLLARDADGFDAYDSAAGRMRLADTAALRGTAYFFRRAEPAPPQAGWISQALMRLRPLVGQAMLSALVYGLVLLPAPLFVLAVYARIIPSGSLANLLYFTLGAVAAVAVGGIFIVHRARILAFVAGRIDYVFGTAVFRQILALPPSMSESAALGPQVARLNSFESMRELFVGPIASTLLEVPAVAAFIVALAIISPLALLIVFLMVLLYLGVYFMIAPVVERRVGELARLTTRRHEFLIETLNKLRALREFGGEHTWLARFRDVSSAATMAGYRVGRMSAVLAASAYFITMQGSLAVLAATIVYAAHGVFGVGVVLASIMLAWRIVGPLQTAFVNLARIDRVRNVAQQMNRLMALRGERPSAPTAIGAREFRGRVEFERVSFRYSLDADPALVGVTFSVQPGQLAAVIGPNGGGKSTLLKLLAALYQAQAGSVQLDGIDLRQMDPVDLRRAIGYVPQECSLFRGTIAQNLRLVRPAATEEELNRALALAGALNDVALLPEGADTRMGDGLTERLPASLRQKLSLARAYLTRSPVLLFDEPANTLDAEGDRWFIDALAKLRGSSTIFLVTHRPSHIRLADVALLLQGGYLRFAGPPAEALKRPGMGT